MTLATLHLHAGNLFGGVERILVTLAEWQGRVPELRSEFGLTHDGRLAADLRAAGSRVTPLGPVRISRPWTVWSGRRRAAALLRESRPDLVVVHSGWSQAIFSRPAVARGVPVVRWQHAPPGGPPWLERWAARTPPARYVCTSEYIRAALLAADPAALAGVVHPPVPAPAAPAAGRAETRAALDAGDRVVILQVGRMEAWKGHAVLLRALATLNHRADWVAWIVGGAQRDSETRYVGSLALLAAGLGLAQRVRFLGDRPDPGPLYAAADLVCQPNVAPEPFGITQIEALYAGRPVVSSAAGGALEIVDHTCGVLVEPGSPPALAAALGRLLDDAGLRGRLGRAGPARAAALSDPARQIPRLAAALAAATGRTP